MWCLNLSQDIFFGMNNTIDGFLIPWQVDENLFRFEGNQTDRLKENADSSDSEESYYSGLESESETSDGDDDDEQDSNSVRFLYLMSSHFFACQKFLVQIIPRYHISVKWMSWWQF